MIIGASTQKAPPITTLRSAATAPQPQAHGTHARLQPRMTTAQRDHPTDMSNVHVQAVQGVGWRGQGALLWTGMQGPSPATALDRLLHHWLLSKPREYARLLMGRPPWHCQGIWGRGNGATGQRV
jgi:hypothetical protein